MNSIDALLLSKHSVEGPRRVTATLRPLRIAFLIDSTNPACALAAVSSCTLSWGGALHVLVPCASGGEPEGIWSYLLDLHDPDEIVDMVGASSIFSDHQRKSLDRVIVRWNHESIPLMIRGATVFSPLRLQKDKSDLRPDLVCPDFTLLAEDAFALPLAFRWGYLTKETLSNNFLMKHALESSHHGDFVKLDSIDPASLTNDQLIAHLTERTAAREMEEHSDMLHPSGVSLLDLTLTRMGGHMSFPESWESTQEERRYGHPHDHCVVVIGSPSSVPDFCLAWNIRALHPGADPFPLWVNPSWLGDPAVAQRLERARVSARGRRIHEAVDPWLGFVSATLAPGELAELVKIAHRTFVMDDTRLKKFFPSRLTVGIERESIANFEKGQSDIVLPELAKLGRFHEHESLGVSVEIDGWTSPKAAGPPFHSSNDIVRVSNEGVSGQLRLFGGTSTDLVHVHLNSAWQIMNQVVNRVGYKAEISDKGRQAIAILNLIQDPQDLSLLASSNVYALLRDMARIVPRQAVQQTLRRVLARDPSEPELADVLMALDARTIDGGQFDRPHYDWSRLRTALGVPKEEATWVVEWLVRHRFLFRGYEVSCPACGLKRWYPVDRLATLHLCDGCQATMPLPVSVSDGLVWRYRLNEAVALGVDQGVLPHLLAVRRIRQEGSRSMRELLGLIPGLALTPLTENGPPSIEVDLFAIHEGKVLLGECKAHGAELTAAEVERFAALGKLLDGASIIYATPTNFDGITEVVDLAKNKSRPIDIQLWEAPDMIDPRPYESVPHDSPSDYLRTLVNWRRNYSE